MLPSRMNSGGPRMPSASYSSRICVFEGDTGPDRPCYVIRLTQVEPYPVSAQA